MTKCSQAFDLERTPAFDACTELIFGGQRGLLTRPRSLAPWMFYDELGSGLFERITALSECYFMKYESIHTQNSYKFSDESIERLLQDSCFEIERMWKDERGWYAVTLARPHELKEYV